jgi:ferredoxin
VFPLVVEHQPIGSLDVVARWRPECRGCGLCSTGCPAGAIAMRPLVAPA